MNSSSIVYPGSSNPTYQADDKLDLDLEAEISDIARERLMGLADWRYNNLTKPTCWTRIKTTSEYFCCLGLPIFILVDFLEERPIPENRNEALILKLNKAEDCLKVQQMLNNQ